MPQAAKAYRAAGVPWLVVADRNYGEGSAREHAAMQPRFLGARARGCRAPFGSVRSPPRTGGRCVIARTFARIHETNLKKQGLLPLTFVDPNDYDRISGASRVSIALGGGALLRPGVLLEARVRQPSGETATLQLRHTMSEEQIEWFKQGSALNVARNAASARG